LQGPRGESGKSGESGEPGMYTIQYLSIYYTVKIPTLISAVNNIFIVILISIFCTNMYSDINYDKLETWFNTLTNTK